MTSTTPPSPARTSTARPSILVVLGHPRSDSLCGALADAYADGARAAGADVTVLRLGDTDFDLASREHSLQRWLGPDQEPARETEVEAMITAVHAAPLLPRTCSRASSHTRPRPRAAAINCYANSPERCNETSATLAPCCLRRRGRRAYTGRLRG